MTGLFIVLSAVSILGGVGVVATRNIVHAALFLLVSLMAIAGIYLILFTEFLALVQILIYGGAIVIVLLFAIMMTRGSDYPRISDNRQWPLALIASIALAVVLSVSFWTTSDTIVGPQHAKFSDIGNSLFTRWAIPFEIASLVLLVALIGAIIIARSNSEDNN
ncbi:MAG: NADH-quinone oxidoreductase subunit J [Chloroflexota bacterium]|nr:NADH-quinone oxidoreductase subunit J [Chloroflexota bacterium]